MNQLTTYEIAIAGKVQQLPLPNMADNIWASIEQQLDLDLHADDSSSSNQTPAKLPVKAIIVGGIITAIVVAVLLVVQLNKKHKRSSSPTQNPQPVQTIPNNNPAAAPPDPQQILQPSGTVTFENKLPVQKDSSINSSNKNGWVADSLFQPVPAPTNSINLPDLTPGNPINFKPLLPDTNSIKPAGTKPRGVKGISNDDYRISAGKDSLKKGG